MMSFSEIKDEILLRSRGLELCEMYQKVFNSTTFLELIDAADNLILWVVTNGIVDETMLLDFPEADLNSYGIYFNNTYSLTNPDISDYNGFHEDNIVLESADSEIQTLYCYKDCIMNLTLNGSSACKVIAMENSQVNANLSGTSRLEIAMHHTSDLDATLIDNSFLCLEANGASTIAINAANSAITRGKLSGKSISQYVAVDSSYAFINTYKFAILNHMLTSPATSDFKKYHSSQINPVTV